MQIFKNDSLLMREYLGAAPISLLDNCNIATTVAYIESVI